MGPIRHVDAVRQFDRILFHDGRDTHANSVTSVIPCRNPFAMALLSACGHGRRLLEGEPIKVKDSFKVGQSRVGAIPVEGLVGVDH